MTIGYFLETQVNITIESFTRYMVPPYLVEYPRHVGMGYP
jgi:hypothetical protein